VVNTNPEAAERVAALRATLNMHAPARPTPMAGGGIVPPPGAVHFAPPTPPPDPRRDPFGAMSAAAQAARPAVAQQPAIYIVNDGEPVEDLHKKSVSARFGKWLALALVPLVVGWSCGRIQGGRAEHNRTIEDARTLAQEIEGMKGTLGRISAAVTSSDRRSKGNPDFRLVQELTALGALRPAETTRIFRTNYAKMDDLAVDLLMTYYSDSTSLYEEIRRHIKRTTNDKAAIESYLKSAAEPNQQKNYGVIITAGAIPIGNLVEIGDQVCADAAKAGDCPANKLKGFTVRTAPGATFFEKSIKGGDAQRVIPLEWTELFRTVASGNPAIVAVRSYSERMAKIRALLTKLTQVEKDLLQKLEAVATKDKLFAL
jgi:hypothetical protein